MEDSWRLRIESRKAPEGLGSCCERSSVRLPWKLDFLGEGVRLGVRRTAPFLFSFYPISHSSSFISFSFLSCPLLFSSLHHFPLILSFSPFPPVFVSLKKGLYRAVDSIIPEIGIRTRNLEIVLVWTQQTPTFEIEEIGHHHLILLHFVKIPFLTLETPCSTTPVPLLHLTLSPRCSFLAPSPS